MAKSLEQALYKKKIQMANKYTKRCSFSLEIGEMQTTEMQTKWNPEILIHNSEWEGEKKSSNTKWSQECRTMEYLYTANGSGLL